MDEKTPKKKTSLYKTIKNLRERVKQLEARGDSYHEQLLETGEKYHELKSCLTFKVYKVNFSIKCNDGKMHEFFETKRAANAIHAIQLIKFRKAYPNTFELIDMKVFE